MEAKNLYETIYKRKSIRKFKLTPLDTNKLTDIRNYIETIIPLFPEIETEIKIVYQVDVNGLIQVKAPHYIVAFSEEKEGYLTNMGFMLQQLDLYFSANGLGCCWQGWPKPTTELRNNRNLEFVIVLAFGLPNEKLHRASMDEYKRKPLDKIRDIKGFDKFIESARIAPSPSQPWFFTGDGNTIHICCVKTGSLITKLSRTLSLMEQRLYKIEIGIAACHLWIAALYFDKKVRFFIKKNERITLPNNYFYILSINMQ